MLLFTLIGAFIYGQYVKLDAIQNLAQVDAKKTSKLVFETLYSAMARGWTKDDLKAIVERLNKIDEKMHIEVFRGEKVEELYGKYGEHKNTDSLKNALAGKEMLDVVDDNFIEYHYPIFAKNECLACHTNAKPNDVLGVINIIYPVGDLKISLNEMINFFMGFIVLFSFLVFITLFITFRKHLLRPMKDFVNLIDSIRDSKDIKKRVNIEDNIEEIKYMQNVFNGMLDSIEYQFYNDPLTGLKNRRSLLEVLDEKHIGLLMILNVDRFQEINNLYGNEAGDIVLKNIAELLQKLLPKDAGLYRLHSDEFAYYTNSGMDLLEFEELTSYIISAIEQNKFNVEGIGEIPLRVSGGIASGSTTLLANADIALKIAKKEKKHFLTYNDSMKAFQQFEQNINWAKRLDRAIDEDKITPLYQPIAECRSGRIVKYECLMRMEDESGDYISPVHFLELAKKNKIYHKLTKAIVRKAFTKFRHSKLSFSINLSPEDILNKEVATQIIKELSSGEFRDRMVIEIVESDWIGNFDEVAAFIEGIKKYGAKVSIDDFGTGYSNFEYLLKLNVDYLKIDGSMIKNITTDKGSQAVVQTIVEFARKIGVETVAEFVYSKAIFDKVKELGIDYAQGYYLGQPTDRIDVTY